MAEHRLVIGLNAVLAAIGETTPHVLCVERDGGWGLPFGPFDPANHRTFEIGLRDFVTGQTAIPLGYVEQLYTFGDLGRVGFGRERLGPWAPLSGRLPRIRFRMLLLATFALPF